MKDKLKTTLLCFPICSKYTLDIQCIITHDLLFVLLFIDLFLCYFSLIFFCVTFHVITWLLSFIIKIMSFMPMFRVLWSQHSMLYMVWSRLCWCMSPQKLLFCYHLPTRGRAGVKLGDAWYVSNVSIIVDAPCLFMHHFLCVLLHFVAFLCIFWN
jgi:hypothetical protein